MHCCFSQKKGFDICQSPIIFHLDTVNINFFHPFPIFCSDLPVHIWVFSHYSTSIVELNGWRIQILFVEKGSKACGGFIVVSYFFYNVHTLLLYRTHTHMRPVREKIIESLHNFVRNLRYFDQNFKLLRSPYMVFLDI